MFFSSVLSCFCSDPVQIWWLAWLFHVYIPTHSQPSDKASSLLRSLLLIESQPCSLWLACVLAFESLLIQTAVSAQIIYPLILHRRPYNWDSSHLACIPEHQRHQRRDDLSKLELTSLCCSQELCFISFSLSPDFHVISSLMFYGYSSVFHNLTFLLVSLRFFCQSSPSHFIMLESWRWTLFLLHNVTV